jgi:hypothetical protein
VHIDRAAHALRSAFEVATLGHREPGPEQELVAGGRQLSGPPVALGRLAVAALADQVVALGRHRIGIRQVEQAAQLAEGIGVILDPKLDRSLPRLALRRDDDEGSGLTAPYVPARGLPRIERGEPAIMFAWALKSSPST